MPVFTPPSVASGGEVLPSPAEAAPGNTGVAVVAVCAKALPCGQKIVQASSRVAAFRDVGRRVAVPFTFIPFHPASLADAGSKARQGISSDPMSDRPMK
ncbi:hypothetical protein AGR4C_Lc50238 [Agrobacterium tumefaciens str. Kerr 14]|uniref:Uncharacterized protein n=1 Tax=Agrobacterium tumefaciens str. Kerr 14 TaxID=1183424 RepID=A0A1S7RX88_AGRTU|nr:hypothetical protein AGR4C_Lc50238 [Agrobacterium tumefaciens str. Kerr 14]